MAPPREFPAVLAHVDCPIVVFLDDLLVFRCERELATGVEAWMLKIRPGPQAWTRNGTRLRLGIIRHKAKENSGWLSSLLSSSLDYVGIEAVQDSAPEELRGKLLDELQGDIPPEVLMEASLSDLILDVLSIRGFA